MSEPTRCAIPEGVHPVDWLVSLRSEYADTPLANWEGRYTSSFLEGFARLKADFPQHLRIAADYLFAGSAYTHCEKLRRITRSDVFNRQLDRRASMQGGFPWTDETHPWPSEMQDDGSIRYARPVLQLNMKVIGSALKLDLPELLYQVWEEHFGDRWIDLSETSKVEASWDLPDIDAEFANDMWEPFGWAYVTEEGHPDYDWIGNLIDIDPHGAMTIPDMAWCSVNRLAWQDVYRWVLDNGGSYDPPLSSFIERIQPLLTEVEFRELQSRFDELIDLGHNELVPVSDARDGGAIGAFQGIPLNLLGNPRYENLLMTGQRMLYEPASRDEGQPGLDFFNGDGSFMVTLFEPNNLLAGDGRPKVDFSYHRGWVNA